MSYAPSPQPHGDNVARVVCALIAVLAVLAAVVLLLVGNEPPAKATVQQPGGPGSAATSAGSGGGGVATTSVSPSYLVDHFPVPPGQTDVRTSASPDGTKSYDLNGGLSYVRSFVGSRLDALGFTWFSTQNSTGYTGAIKAREKVVGALVLTTISGTQTRATVKITG